MLSQQGQLTRFGALLGRHVLEAREPTPDLLDLGLLLDLAHRLVLLRPARGGSSGGGGGPRFGRVVRFGSVAPHEVEELVEDVVGELVDVELDFVFLDALVGGYTVSSTCFHAELLLMGNCELTLRLGMFSRIIFSACAMYFSGNMLMRFEISCFCS